MVKSMRFHSASVRTPVLLMASRHFGFLIAAPGRAAIPNNTALTAGRIARSMLTPVIAEPHTTLDCSASPSLRQCTPCCPGNSVDKLQHSVLAHTQHSWTTAGRRLHSLPPLAVSRQTGYTRWRANSAPSSSLLQEAPLPWPGLGCHLLPAVDPPERWGLQALSEFGYLHRPWVAATLPSSFTFYASSYFIPLFPCFIGFCSN